MRPSWLLILLALSACGEIQRTTSFSSDVFDAPAAMAARAPRLLDRHCNTDTFTAESVTESHTTELGLQRRSATIMTSC